MRKNTFSLSVILLLNTFTFAQVREVDSSLKHRELVSYLKSHGKSPEAYIISKFIKHDVVLLGEPHWVRQHVTLVSGLIPRLHKRGINILAIEFARRVDQPLIDSLLNAPAYDEQLARLPADGILDQALASAGKRWKRVGFDLNGTPFGRLVSHTAVYKHGYEPLTLDEFADGWVYVGPISQYEAVTPVKDFINESNIEYARANSSNPDYRTASIADFNRRIASSLEGAKKRWQTAAGRLGR